MRKSHYNIVKSIGKNTWIYNTLTGSFIKWKTDSWKSLGLIGTDFPEELISSGIIVEDIENELLTYQLKYYRAAFDNRHLHLDIAPTMKCNFACHYCFEEGNKNQPVMDNEVEQKLVAFIEANRSKEILINWFGGEPLLGFDKIISISEKLDKLNIKYKASIVTNGSLLTKEKSEKMNQLHVNRVQVTLDGIGDIHDQRRFFKNGKPSFETIITNIRNFLHLCNAQLMIQVTIDNTNITAYTDVNNYFAENFREEIETKRILVGKNYVQDRTGFDNQSACFSSKDKLDDKINGIKHHNEKDMGLPGLALPCMYRQLSSFSIDSEGNIYHCLEHLGMPDNKIGSIKEGKILLSKLASTILGDNPFEDKKCINCNVFPICGGGCPIDRLKKKRGEGINYCSSYKYILGELLPYIYKYKYETTNKE